MELLFLSKVLHFIKYVCMLSPVQLFATHALQSTRLLCPWNFPGKNTGVGCHLLLQGIFPIQESKPNLLQADSLPLSSLGNALFVVLPSN